MQVIYILSYTY